MSRCLVILCCLFLSACLGRIDLSDVATTGGAVGGAVVGTALGGGVPTVLVTTTAGAVAGAVAVEDTTAHVSVTDVKTPEQAEVAKSQIFWNFVQEFVMYIVGAFVVLMVAMWLIPGPQSLIPRRKKDGGTDSTNNRTGSSWRNS